MGKLKRKKVMENIFTILIIIGLIIFGIQHRRERDNFKSKLLQDASYSIGEVSYYRSGRSPLVVPKFLNSTGRTPAVEYSFIADSKRITNKYDAYKAEVPTDGVREGEKYLVLYKNNDPSENRMLFKYPIKDSMDFKKYINEFEQIRWQNKGK